ncbi:MAG: hypothetical protein A3G76_07710 [Acidobacteria bacterium RIFCSPLOWO2_12_FULL_65_11]|nr:MAG: hypothetical protein A3G76_07710 [Acidobacteria bacterium RIFCSPLOWO2_12_FULL_65_11]
MQIADYCREVEAYLCRKNDGHLIRIVGPSFDLVSAWASRGVPLRIACRGIDRYVERYYAKGPRRRPVRIDFCEADVLEAFDEWRRTTGLAADAAAGTGNDGDRLGGRRLSGLSLPAHLERALRRLTSARASGALDATFDRVLDEVSRELDAARQTAGGVRGAARQALVERLAALDREMLRALRLTLDEASRAALTREAEEDLTAFRAGMAADVFARARDAAVDRLLRERFGLPTVAFL